MTGKRKSKRVTVVKKSLKLQEKLTERAKKKGVANPKKSSSSTDKTSAAKDNSNLTSNFNKVLTLQLVIAQKRVVTKKSI